MIHQRQRLTFRFKPRHNTLGVHPDPDDLERDMAANRFSLFRPINDAETSFANLLQKFVASDELADALLADGKSPRNFQRFTQKARRPVFQEGISLIMSEQFFNSFLEPRIASG